MTEINEILEELFDARLFTKKQGEQMKSFADRMNLNLHYEDLKWILECVSEDFMEVY